MGLKKTVFSGVKWTTASAIFTTMVKLLQVCILTRVLDKSDFGIIAIALLFISLSDIFVDLGLTSAVLHKKEITTKQYNSLFWANCLLSLLLAFALFFSAPIISNYYSEGILLPIIRLLSLNLLFSGVSRLHRTCFQKRMDFKFLSIVDFIGASLILLLTLIFVFFDFGIYSLVYSNLGSSLIVSLVFFYFGTKYNFRIRLYFRLYEIRPFLGIGFYQFASSLLDFCSREVDIIVIGALYPLEVLGSYSLCKQLILKLYGVLNPILAKVLTPLLATIQSNREEITRIYSKVIEFLSFLNYPLYFLIAAISYPLLSVLYGTTYGENYLLLSIIAITYGINSVASPVGALQIALGRTDLGFYWTIFRLTSVIFTIVFFSKFSILIMALSLLLLTIISMSLLFVFLIKKMTNLKYFGYFKLQAFPFFTSLLVAIPLLWQKEIYNNYFTVFIFSLFFIFCYCSVLYMIHKRLVVECFDSIICISGFKKYD